MNNQTRFETDLTVRSFAYVAKQLAKSAVLSPNALYEQVLNEAEKHRNALRMVQRDVFESTEWALRKSALTKTEFTRLRENVVKAVAQAQEEITRIAARYAPHKLAA